MAAFRRLFFAALCAGLVAGGLAAIAHQLGTVPLILKAEIYEQAAEHPAPTAAVLGHHHSHAAAAMSDHHADAWEPANGLERSAYTLLADLLTGVGFALLLAAGIACCGGEGGWRDGLLWGLAGFAVFTLAPGLGLPPEVPGSAAAPLLARQLWWLATAASTGAGLALIVFTRRPLYAVLAAGLIILPHLWGAPPPPADAAAAAPEELARRFAVLVTAISFLFWAALGAATGYFYHRFEPRSG